jgi:hypothetical protein
MVIASRESKAGKEYLPIRLTCQGPANLIPAFADGAKGPAVVRARCVIVLAPQ